MFKLQVNKRTWWLWWWWWWRWQESANSWTYFQQKRALLHEWEVANWNTVLQSHFTSLISRETQRPNVVSMQTTTMAW